MSVIAIARRYAEALADHRPAADSEVVARLRRAGAIILGQCVGEPRQGLT